LKDTNAVFSDDKIKHNKRVNNLAIHKRRNIEFADWVKNSEDKSRFFELYQGGIFNKLSNMIECHSYLLFREYFETGKIKLHDARHCDLHLLCPLCAIRRASKKYKLYVDRTKQLLEKYPNMKLYYLVLTVKNGADLQERYLHLNESCKKLIKRRREAKNYHKGNKKNKYAISSVFANVIAGSYSIEVKKGQNSNLWHPHANFLLLSNKMISYKKTIDEWSEITKDSNIVHFSLIPYSKIEKAFLEIFKYALKFSDMELEDNFIAWETLKGKRLLGSFGEFRGLDALEIPENEADLGEFIEFLYKFDGFSYKRAEMTKIDTS
jgi:plasmid rolling circle replication initiator protein Rep